uniref:ATP synthase subunit a n=1 Tax=Groenewaldozyma salmanticensis TaxID=49332 RepID=E5L094_9ASCO|nr:ATP synthase F0 subunit a [Groenewaldozyma salmanticensis]ADO51059.1 ATP synthase F0 subunit a [Groenewaldozyma salmanticensis]
MYINSPLEQFEIHNLIDIDSPLFDLSYLSISNYVLYNAIVLLLIIIVHFYSVSNYSIIPTKWTITIEGIYSTVSNMVINQIGERGQQYIPFIYSLFTFILFTNWLGLVPYSYASTAQLVFTIGLSFTIWLGITILGLIKKGWKFFDLFVPSGCGLALVPLLVIIETVSYIARAISLGLRLGANILSGHILIAILTGLTFDFIKSSVLFAIIGIIPLTIILAIIGLECAISAIQAYVFSILTCSYIKDALYGH